MTKINIFFLLYNGMHQSKKSIARGEVANFTYDLLVNICMIKICYSHKRSCSVKNCMLGMTL